MAYLRLIAQGAMMYGLRAHVNKPKRGIGDASVRPPRLSGADFALPLRQRR